MDEKEMIKWGLIALGAYLIYEYIQQQGGLTNVLAGSTTPAAGTSPTTGTAATQAQLQMAIAQLAPMGITLTAAQQALILANGVNYQQQLTPAQYQQYLSFFSSAPAPTNTTKTTACPQGQLLQNGACVRPAAAAVPISVSVLNAATSAGEPNSLNFDQWCYYYAQVTGNNCSAIPAITTQQLVSAGVQPNADGSGPDYTSPMPVSTWLALMQLQAPSLGLTGFRGMGSFGSYRPLWLN